MCVVFWVLSELASPSLVWFHCAVLRTMSHHFILSHHPSAPATSPPASIPSVLPCIPLRSTSESLMHCTLSLTVCKCTLCQRASFNSTTDSFSWGHDPYTLACKARPSSDRCWTSLSVSVSLSLSTSLSFLHPKPGVSFKLCELTCPAHLCELRDRAVEVPHSPSSPAWLRNLRRYVRATDAS